MGSPAPDHLPDRDALGGHLGAKGLALRRPGPVPRWEIPDFDGKFHGDFCSVI